MSLNKRQQKIMNDLETMPENEYLIHMYYFFKHDPEMRLTGDGMAFWQDIIFRLMNEYPEDYEMISMDCYPPEQPYEPHELMKQPAALEEGVC